MARRNSVFMVYRLILPLIVFGVGLVALLFLIVLNSGGHDPGRDHRGGCSFDWWLVVDLELCRLDQ